MTHGVRGEGRCFIGWRRLCRIAPSGISRGGWLRGCPGNAGATVDQSVSSFRPGHVNAPDVPEPEIPSTGGDHASALARARRGALLSSADEGNRRTGSSMFENFD
jgi:hypothetical protein